MNFKQILFKILFILGTIFWCIIVGGFLGGRVFTSPGEMGWDALANALGGMMLGGVLGLIISVILAIFLKGRAMLVAYLVSGSILIITLLAILIRNIVVSAG